MRLWNFRGEQSSISEALQLELPAHAVISVTGAGGKTSLIFEWARELSADGKKVAVTTTTHMMDPERMKMEPRDLYEGAALISVPAEPSAEMIEKIKDDIGRLLGSAGIVFVFSPDPGKPGKVKAPSGNILDFICGTADVTLIEADGSRRLPLKWPASWEPAAAEGSDITVCVAGLSALGKSTSDVIYRAEHLPERLRRELVDEALINALLISDEGGQKDARGELRFFLNQADNEEQQASASKIQAMLAACGLMSAWGTLAAKADPPRIAVILEAAGNSTRFGSNKLLHSMADGRPMVESILEKVRGLDVFKKILVTQYDEVAALAPDFDVVINDRPDLGISRSMQLGIKAAGDADAYMFCVCDQPWLSASTIRSLIDAYTCAFRDACARASEDGNKKGTAAIVSLAWRGELCNPKIFSSVYRDELMSLEGDAGGRRIISDHLNDLIPVEAGSENEVRDIDRPLSADL